MKPDMQYIHNVLNSETEKLSIIISGKVCVKICAMIGPGLLICFVILAKINVRNSKTKTVCSSQD